jgi:hypothetical protein
MNAMTIDDLDGLFASAARDRPEPSPALMDRVLADALALQPQPAFVRPMPAPAPGLLARLAVLFGGGPVLAGVCSAALAGVALGYLSPGTYDYVTGGLADTATDPVELFPTTDFLTSEG